MDESTLKKRRRNLPHWTIERATYFLTFRVARATLSAEERKLVLDHLRAGHATYYQLAAAVVMPDHVHLMLQPLPSFELSRIMKGIKGASARKINLHRRTSGSIWQDESYDRIVRDAEEFADLLQYMADNPLKAGLVSRLEDYDGWFHNAEIA